MKKAILLAIIFLSASLVSNGNAIVARNANPLSDEECRRLLRGSYADARAMLNGLTTLMMLEAKKYSDTEARKVDNPQLDKKIRNKQKEIRLLRTTAAENSTIWRNLCRN